MEMTKDEIWEHKKGRIWQHVRKLEQENRALRYANKVLQHRARVAQLAEATDSKSGQSRFDSERGHEVAA